MASVYHDSQCQRCIGQGTCIKNKSGNKNLPNQTNSVKYYKTNEIKMQTTNILLKWLNDSIITISFLI